MSKKTQIRNRNSIDLIELLYVEFYGATMQFIVAITIETMVGIR